MTETPAVCTAEGSRASTLRTRDWTSFSASVGSTLSSKVSVIDARPCDEVDSKYKSPSSPVSVSSMGVVTEFCTASAVAPL